MPEDFFAFDEGTAKRILAAMAWFERHAQNLPGLPESPVIDTNMLEVVRVTSATTLSNAKTATIAAGGTGYTVGDLLTLSGGTSTTTGKFRVTTVSGGAVTAVTLDNSGAYSAQPGNPVSTTGGTGSGCTLTVTWVNRYSARIQTYDAVTDTWSDLAAADDSWVMEPNGEVLTTTKYSSRRWGPAGPSGRPVFSVSVSGGGGTSGESGSRTVYRYSCVSGSLTETSAAVVLGDGLVDTWASSYT